MMQRNYNDALSIDTSLRNLWESFSLENTSGNSTFSTASHTSPSSDFGSIGDGLQFALHQSSNNQQSSCKDLRPAIGFVCACNDRNQIVARCKECNENLCSECVGAHKRVRLTRDHHVLQLETAVTKTLHTNGLQIQSPGSLKGYNTDGACCDVHLLEPLRVHCKNCQRSLCNSCLTLPLTGHNAMHTVVDINQYGRFSQGFSNSISSTQQQSAAASLMLQPKQKHNLANVALNPRFNAWAVDSPTSASGMTSVTNEIVLFTKRLTDEMEQIERMRERIETRVEQVAKEIDTIFLIHVSVLEERKRKLLQKLQTARVVKLDGLRVQKEELSCDLKTLNDLYCYANNFSLQGSQQPDSDYAKDIYLQKLSQVRNKLPSFGPQENDEIEFVPPNPAVLMALRALGSIDTGAFAPNCTIIDEEGRAPVKNKVSSFVVQTKDHSGEPCLRGGDKLVFCVFSPQGNAFLGDVIDRNNGHYVCSYKPVTEGEHILQVLLRQRIIGRHPIKVRVRDGRDYNTVGKEPLMSFGGEGGLDGQLSRPWGICCDRLGRLVVADRSNNRIQVFTSQGQYLFKFGTVGKQNGQFKLPVGVATNSRNEIVVTDKDNHRVQVFNSDGEFLFKFGEECRTSRAQPGLFKYPWGVAINSLDQIAVADTRNHCVQLFAPNGAFIQIYAWDILNFDSPRGLAFKPNGDLVVTDFNKHRLVEINCQTGALKFFCDKGESEAFFQRPQGLDIDFEGNIIVADSRNNRVQVFDSRYSFVCCIGSSDDGTDAKLLNCPCDVCVMPDGKICVLDYGNNRIRIY